MTLRLARAANAAKRDIEKVVRRTRASCSVTDAPTPTVDPAMMIIAAAVTRAADTRAHGPDVSADRTPRKLNVRTLVLSCRNGLHRGLGQVRREKRRAGNCT